MALTLGAVLLVPGSWVSSAQAQDSQPSDQDKAMHYSLYYENYKNDNFERAKSDLLWVVENAPGYPKGDDRNFERQFKLYRGLAEQASDEDARTAYLDTAATVLASAPERMEDLDLEFEAFEWEIMRGQFVDEHEDSLSELPSSLDDSVSHYRTAYDLAPEEINPYYIKRVLRAYMDNNEQQEALEFASAVEQERGEEEEVANIIASVRDDIFDKNPDAQVAYFEDQYEAHSDSLALMQQLFNAYVERGSLSKASDLAPRLMEEDVPAETIREIANMRLEDGRPEDALEAYERMDEMDTSLTAEDHYRMGEAHEQMDQFSRARSQFRDALEKDSEYGRAHIAIGDLYTSAVSDCSGDELGRTDRAVYWAAVDQFQKAKEVDSSVSSTANSKIETYRQYFPSQEDIFYRDAWEEGEEFTIDSGCYSWIDETTTVRRSPS
ncbi:MAG: hypothetical protein R6T83_04400 [Salinibacter sp.]